MLKLNLSTSTWVIHSTPNMKKLVPCKKHSMKTNCRIWRNFIWKMKFWVVHKHNKQEHARFLRSIIVTRHTALPLFYLDNIMQLWNEPCSQVCLHCYVLIIRLAFWWIVGDVPCCFGSILTLSFCFRSAHCVASFWRCLWLACLAAFPRTF